MRIRRHGIGDKRWHLSVYFNGGNEKHEFERWMKEHMPECYCVCREEYHHNDYQRYFEVRGTDTGKMMMLLLSWAT